MRGAENLKVQVMESVLDRAGGNFLWVHLVLEEILGCHTPQAIKQIIEEVPAGMSAWYERMERSVANNPRTSDRVLAKTLFNWVVCAHHPLTLQELSQALQSEYLEFLDLKSTIQDVCGQLVVVDSSSKVALVHKTARDFLTTTPKLQLFVDESASHRELFVKTISFLLRPELRSKLARNQQTIGSVEPFLLYAATSLMFHLRQSAVNSEDIIDTLAMFFEGAFVLVWIHFLALSNQLEVLISAAEVLNWFSGLCRKLDIEIFPWLHRRQRLELFELWATDLVRIVAKFGRHLLDDPTAIYKIIPSLCPQDSIMSRKFRDTELSVLSVSGISHKLWSDCLARLYLHENAKAWKIKCAASYIAVLSSAGSIILWDSVTFNEICTLQHAEFVTDICFGSKCDKIVSYGLKTTKVWAIPSGQLTANIPNPDDSKALAITLSENDRRVLIGSDDNKVRYTYVDADKPRWHMHDPTLLQEDFPVQGGIITCPSFMTFNRDATQIAVAYRGHPLSVWATHERRLIGRCRRIIQSRPDDARPLNSWMAVDRAVWNPVADQLLGLYRHGTVFKWNPTTDENQEVSTIADEVEISPDGKLFVTSNSKGTITLWEFASSTMIYQILSEHLVTDLAFSPDSKRFYDTRASSVNVWEPNSLIRFADNEQTIIDSASNYQQPSFFPLNPEARTEPVSPISALATTSGSKFYCASHENGTVDIFDTNEGKLLEVPGISTFLSIYHLVWGEDGRHLAAADLGANITVKRIETPSPADGSIQPSLRSLLVGKAKVVVGGIHQILLNPESTK